MSAAPRLTVILAVHDGEQRLDDALRRLLDQDAAGFEVVVVDDGSRDGSPRIAQEWAAADSRVRAVPLAENVGVAHARRRGVEEARGEYVWFVDDDDAWPPDALRTLAEAATTTGADVVVAGAEFAYESGARRPLPAPSSTPVSGARALELLLRGEISGHLWNKLFRRSVMARASFAPARTQSDLAMTADALSFAETVAFEPATVYEYRLRSGSLITSASARRDSLALVEAAVRAAAGRAGLAESDAWHYFLLRYIVLSGLKDAVLGPYPAPERSALVSGARSRMSPSDLVFLARMRDPRRLLLAATGKYSLPLYRRVLAAAERG